MKALSIIFNHVEIQTIELMRYLKADCGHGFCYRYYDPRGLDEEMSCSHSAKKNGNIMSSAEGFFAIGDAGDVPTASL